MDSLWRFCLLGGLTAQYDGQSITRFKSQRVGALLAYLAFYGRQMHAREALIDRFWPESSLDAGRNSLSVALSSLRHQLEPPGTPAGSVLRADRFSVGLNPQVIATDVAQFEAALQAADQARGTTDRRLLLESAVALFAGPLLPGLYDAWILPEQTRLAGLFAGACDRLIADLSAGGEWSAALRYAHQAIRVDPLREEACAALMRLLGGAGQPAAALRQYRELERRLDAALGEEPSATLRALARQIERQSEGETSPAVATPSAPPPPEPDASFPVTRTLWLVGDEGALPADARAMLRSQTQRHGGQVLRESADTYLAAFPSAHRALAAALDTPDRSQRTMALHTGDITVIDGAFHGASLRDVARIRAAAHLGQFLVSEACAGLLRRDLADGVDLIDLGFWRLEEGTAPERLFQIAGAGSFPPLRAIRPNRARLPLRVTRFFGREAEIDALSERLLSPETRLVTLTGPGGTGKTRLALEVGERLVERFDGAVTFVPLADTIDSQRIADAILDTLQLPRAPGRDSLEQVIDALSRQPSLLILDNLEQLVGVGGSEVVEALISGAPTLTVLATSRQRLGLAAEREFALSPLPTPLEGQAPELLSAFESVQLFLDRAQAVKPDFQVTNRNAAALAELVSRLEGIPLAIELAAARAQVLTPAQMLAQMEQPFAFLVSRRRDVRERHRTLHAAVDWSYQLLTPELRRFFCRLSVFRGGWTVEAAEDICEEPLALDYLAQLCECSLVLAREGEGGIRFAMLETLREFGWERLAPDERSIIRDRHLSHFLSCCIATNTHDLPGLFSTAPENFRAAVEWSKTGGDALKGLQMAGKLGDAWWWHGLNQEALEHFSALLFHPDTQAPSSDRANALFWQAWILVVRGDIQPARTIFEESLRIYRQVGDLRGVAETLGTLGDTITHLGLYEEAQALLESGLQLSREIGYHDGIEVARRALAYKALQVGEFSEARRLYDDVAEIRHLRLAEITLLEGDYVTARRLGEEQVRIFQAHVSPQRLGEALLILSGATMHLNELPLASSCCAQSMVHFRAIGSSLYLLKALRRATCIAVMDKKVKQAAIYSGAHESLRDVLGVVLPPCERDEYARNVADARRELGEETFLKFWTSGTAMNQDQAVAYALEDMSTGASRA